MPREWSPRPRLNLTLRQVMNHPMRSTLSPHRSLVASSGAGHEKEDNFTNQFKGNDTNQFRSLMMQFIRFGYLWIQLRNEEGH